MKAKAKRVLILCGALVVVLGVLALAWVTMQDREETGTPEARTDPEVLYWVAPMDPSFRSDKPGKSPMGMDLLPVYAEDSGRKEVQVSPAVQQSMGVRTGVAEIGPLSRRVDATGYVTFDETRLSHVHLRTEAWIERLMVANEGQRVQKGQPLMALYSPELVNAQKEYLQARRRGNEIMASGAEEKLRALGMTDADVDRLREQGTVSQTFEVVAPHDGIVAALNVREGMQVMPATTLMSLADLSSVWLEAEVFESQAQWVVEGQAARARLAYLPGRVFEGQVDYVYPVLDPVTRTLRVRLQFDNPGELLKPNMYAAVSIMGDPRAETLRVPREAVIRSGNQERVIVSVGGGRFRAQEVRTGMNSGAWTEILAGLEPGDEVVTSAQFLLDSEASLTGAIQRLDSTDGASGHAAGHSQPPSSPASETATPSGSEREQNDD